MTDPSLASTVPERLIAILRGPGWRRAALARRWLAGLLALTAAVVAVRGQVGVAGSVPVLIASHDLAPGSVLGPADTRVARWPPELAPAGALTAIADAEGLVIAGAANRGEPLTAPRLAGPELARRAMGSSDAASVPIRLADAGVAALLSPGRQVDIVTSGDRTDQATVLATGATVLTILPAEQKPGGQGRLVLVAVPRAAATRLAAATLAREVTVTLR